MVSQKLMKELTVIQDACMRIVCKVPKGTTVTPLYKRTQALCLPKMITLEFAKYGYKISHKLYLVILHEIADSNGGLKQHRYPTHYKNTPNIQKHTSNEFNQSYLCKGIKRA